MFKILNKKNEVVGQDDNFQVALGAIRSSDNYIVDQDGFKYFADGTGTGFRACRQSNQELFYANHGIYNQTKTKIQNIKNNVVHLKCEFGIKAGLQYLSTIQGHRKNQ